MKLSQRLKQTLCRHKITSNLIFSFPPNTHHIVTNCYKCGKSETVFSGSREEWYEYEKLGSPFELHKELRFK